MRGVRVDFCPRSLPKVEQTALKLRIKTVKNDHSEYCQCCAENECGKNDFQEGFSVCLFDAGRRKLSVVTAENFDNLRDSRNEHCDKSGKRHCRNRKTVDFEICTVFDTVHSEQHGESNYDEYAHQKHGAFLRIHAPDFIEKVKLFRFFFFKSRLKRFACRVLKHIAPGQLIRYIGCRVIKRIFGGILRIICFAASVFHKKGSPPAKILIRTFLSISHYAHLFNAKNKQKCERETGKEQNKHKKPDRLSPARSGFMLP